MHVDVVPNRGSRPAYLLRESFRDGGKVRKRTLANLSSLADEQIDAIRRVLHGERLAPASELFEVTASRIHGDTHAVLTAMKRMGFRQLLSSRPSWEAEVIMGVVADRPLRGGGRRRAGAIVERSVLVVHPIFEVPRPYGLEHLSSLVMYAVLGLVAAALALAFTESLVALRRRFKGARHRWAHPAVGGLATGLLAVLAVATLGAPGVTGGGYATLGAALAEKVALKLLVPLCLLKLAATVFSYSSGGAGGIFAPALFIGGMAGGAVGALDMALLHHSSDALGTFALVGMGAVFAGIIRAPTTSVLIIVEMTGGYSLILPLMIANMLAYGIARHYWPTPIYEALLEQDGVQLREETLADRLERLSPDFENFRASEAHAPSHLQGLSAAEARNS